MIICDSREKKNGHILDYFNRSAIAYRIEKLDVGDYMDEDNPGLSIDRKQDLEELSGNLCSRSNRFWREMRRAHDSGVKMIILIEDGDFGNIEDVKLWKSQYSRVSGRQLANAMYRILMAYGVEFLFCEQADTGRRIVEILNDN